MQGDIAQSELFALRIAQADRLQAKITVCGLQRQLSGVDLSRGIQHRKQIIGGSDAPLHHGLNGGQTFQ